MLWLFFLTHFMLAFLNAARGEEAMVEATGVALKWKGDDVLWQHSE